MQDRPDKEDLLDAVAAFLGRDVLPAIQDRALAFRVRIAAHVLAGVAREVRGEEPRDAAHLAALHRALHRPAPDLVGGTATRDAIRAAETELAGLIRDGDLDDDALAELRAILRPVLAERIRVGNPRFDLSDDPGSPR